MPYIYEEPRKPPRGPDPVRLEATRRINAVKQLSRYRVPEYAITEVEYRQIKEEKRNKPLKPYTSGVQLGLENLVAEETKNNGG